MLDLPEGHALVVTGSLSGKAQDRTHARGAIEPVQVIDQHGTRPVPFFRSIGELGASAFAFVDRGVGHGSTLPIVYFTSGADLLELELEHGSARDHPVGGLVDVHELSHHDGTLYLANTGRDEVVAFSTVEHRVTDRLAMAQFRAGGGMPGTPPAMSEPPAASVDRFHVNQAFRGIDGDLWALVHHAGGKQFLRYVAEKALKVHGNGGVLNLSTGQAVHLGLAGPHSVRCVGSSYWVLDSGRCRAVIFDQHWAPQAIVPTTGWGRGACLSPDGAHLYVGMSPIRRRYLPFMAAGSDFVPTVERVDVGSGETTGRVELGGIEQINNVYVVSGAITDALLALGRG